MNVLSVYILTGAIFFALGVIGLLTRRNLIIMFLSTEIMLQGVILNLIGFGVAHGSLVGQAFAMFLVVIAAVEAGLALGLVMLLFRRQNTLDVEAWRTLRG